MTASRLDRLAVGRASARGKVTLMSRVIGADLPAVLLQRLSIEHAFDCSDEAIVICTIDDDGQAHPAMLSSLEVVARDAHTIALTTHAASRTTRHLKTNGKLTLIIVNNSGAFYVKGDAILIVDTMAAAPDQVAFNMRVSTVLEDNPAAYENARITTGVCVTRGSFDASRSRAILDELTTVRPG